MLEKRFIVKEDKAEDFFDRINSTIWYLKKIGEHAFSSDNADLMLPNIVVCERQDVIRRSINTLVSAIKKISLNGFFSAKEADKICAICGINNSSDLFEEVK